MTAICLNICLRMWRRALELVESSLHIVELEPTLVLYAEYTSPAIAERRLQASDAPACVLTIGVIKDVWNFETMMKSQMVAAVDLVGLIINDLPRLSRARIHILAAPSIVALNAETADILTWFTLAARNSVDKCLS